MKEIKYTILFCVFVRTFYYGSGTVPAPTFWPVTVPVPKGKKLGFLRFRFHNTAHTPRFSFDSASGFELCIK